MAKRWTNLAAGLVLIGLAASSTRGEFVTFQTGNGSIGSTDSIVGFEQGPANSAFATAFTAADFTAASSGPKASILSPNYAWVAGLAEDPGAKWVGTNATADTGQGYSALYAISFTLTQPFATATLDLHFADDDQLGSSVNQGIFLNGTALSGDTVQPAPYSYYEIDSSLVRVDVGSLLHVGLNTIYFDVSNTHGGPSGLIAYGTITTAVPEPSALSLLGLGLLLPAGYALRARRAKAVEGLAA